MGKNTTSVYIENNTGQPITNIKYSHRYDSDVFNSGEAGAIESNQSYLIGVATYWTGFGRTGYDYWWVEFNRDDKTYTCKANFYCYLTSDDADSGKPVTLILNTDSMEVVPPVSSNCTVRLYEPSQLYALITEEHEASGLAESNQPEETSKKSCMQTG